MNFYIISDFGVICQCAQMEKKFFNNVYNIPISYFLT